MIQGAQYLTMEKLAGLDPASLLSGDLDLMKPGENSLTAPDPVREAWKAERLGMITCSCFGKVTRGRGGKGWSETALSYMYDLIGEHVTGQPASDFTGSKATQWGEQYEPMAIAEYERQFRRKVQTGKFYRAEGFRLVGGTPDGVGNIGLEVKCPLSFKNHIRTVITEEIPAEYRDQVNGHMLVTGRKRCVFVSFDPRIERKDLRLKAIEVEWNRDEMEELSDRLYEFEEELTSKLTWLGIDVPPVFKK